MGKKSNSTSNKALKGRGKKSSKKKKKPAQLSELESMKWQLLESKSRAAQAEVERSAANLRFLKSQVPEIVKAEKSVQERQKEFMEQFKEYRMYVEKMCDKFGLDKEKVVFNDVTGVLQELDN